MTRATIKDVSRVAGVSGAGRRVRRTRPESTFGTGQNTLGGTVAMRALSAYHATLALGTP